MPLLGSAALLLCFDVEPDAIDEHDHWHTHEHLPERLAIPGFRRGTRWVATSEGPPYLVLYEVADLPTLHSPAYLARLNDPTPWTRRVMPSYRGMVRGLCAVLASAGHGQGGAAALLRFTPQADGADALRHWLAGQALPAAAAAPGLGSAHLLQGARPAAMTNEQRLRGADRGVDTAIVLTGYRADAVARAAADLCAAEALPRRGARDIVCTSYRLDYELSAPAPGC